MIGFADEKVLPELYEIWQDCFGDNKEYIDIFLECFDLKSTVRMLQEESKGPVSMLSVLPAFFEWNGEIKKAAYLYGVATAKQYREQGYASRLLRDTVEALKAENEMIFLSPAQETLYGFYEQNGFRTVCKRKEWSLSRYEQTLSGVVLQADCTDISPEEYEVLRNRAYEGSNYLQWPLQTLIYAQRENACFGGKMQKVICEGREYGVLYRKEGQKLRILEITEPDEERAKNVALALLYSMKHVQTVCVTRSMAAMAVCQAPYKELQMNLTMG